MFRLVIFHEKVGDFSNELVVGNFIASECFCFDKSLIEKRQNSYKNALINYLRENCPCRSLSDLSAASFRSRQALQTFVALMHRRECFLNSYVLDTFRKVFLSIGFSPR